MDTIETIAGIVGLSGLNLCFVVMPIEILILWIVPISENMISKKGIKRTIRLFLKSLVCF